MENIFDNQKLFFWSLLFKKKTSFNYFHLFSENYFKK